MMRAIIIVFIFIGLIAPLNAQDDKRMDIEANRSYANEQLSNPVIEKKAFNLMLELRCIQCQGQSIADSDAPIAEAMRHQIRLQMKQGKSPEEIKTWMVARYGDFVSFTPPSSGVSLLLWGMPLLVFLLAVFFVIPLFRNKNKNETDGEDVL